ncbi:carboxypeptidase-like regulatory domain-containing protein [Sphingobacterium bambusae]|uniref:Carboxypeptidase-like regulatory domain-containing protein n=1 Tax=Sphingobacterium bambusae TaxID=662858 RepID=A0ABW6BAT5_9SPHI|nr:carboxypeptidase-like regulatory domain-containing protein [Sphingobacterium bambusae]WPL46821.1 carboxypeptidase-like regulatory domain-containing protein [Sphingobacterium bambusae]
MKYFLFFCLILTAHNTWAQHVVQGKVIDAEKREAVAGATVYINNSTVRTSTNKAGEYYLQLPAAGRYELVISAMGHELASFELVVDGNTKKDAVLQQKNLEIDEVTVTAYLKDGWKQWGMYFTESFIGMSSFAKQTKILNPEVLRFRYQATEKVLQVSATEPLQISNRALGYEINYDLLDYHMDFRSGHLYYEGFASFQDSKKISNKMHKNRQAAYMTSFMRFIRSTYSHSWKADGYNVRELIRVVNQERQRVDSLMKLINKRVYTDFRGDWPAFYAAQNSYTVDSVERFRSTLQQPKAYDVLKEELSEEQVIKKTSKDDMQTIHYENYLRITHASIVPEEAYLFWNKKADGSSLLLLAPQSVVYIDALGNFAPAANWIQEGYWAWYSKLSTMLPLDYKDNTQPK